jgi:phosphopantothenoylcysteine decarboxylase/phosphopantothenate--cysteine ligase
VLDPASGRLTGTDTGPGRLPEPEEIFAAARELLDSGAGLDPSWAAPADTDLAGRRVVVSAGGTREHLDPVRFLGNRSSGRQGYALAATAAARGATVTLVAANTALPAPDGVGVVPVTSARELRDAVLAGSLEADAVVMAAAVADFRPRDTSETKIKKGRGEPTEIALVRNPDVLAELAAQPRRRSGQVVVGFAAETGDAEGDVLAHGRAKLARKGCDLLVVNEVGAAGHPTGFEGTQNAAVVLGADGSETPVPLGSKEALAQVVWDLVVARFPANGPAGQDAPPGS